MPSAAVQATALSRRPFGQKYAFVVVAVIFLALLSSADLAGTFTADNSAIIDTSSRTITIPLNGNARFYRLRTVAAPALAIRNVRIIGANVMMDYQ